jgi:predicted MFS family arabinose efflux permease
MSTCHPMPRELAATGEAESLPIAALLALAMTGFTAILTETLPAGLLPRISVGLNVSEGLAGQLVTFYALGSLLAAIPLTAMTQGYRRRPVLLTAILGFLIFNTATAFLSSYVMILAARFLAGVSAGLAWGILAGYARRMVVDSLKGKALAIAMVGTPIALSIGVPLGSFLGSVIGWRAAFLAMSVTTVLLVAVVLWEVPDYPGQTAVNRIPIAQVFMTPGVRTILATIFIWMTGHNILYTYVAPLVARAGLGSRIDLVLLGFGIAALVGIWITGMLVDRMLRRLVILSLMGFAVVALVFAFAGTSPVAVVGAVILWGLAFGGAATQLQTASGDASGDGMDIANAMVTTVWNTAIAAGGILGGLLLEKAGAVSFSITVLAFSIFALGIVLSGHRRAFKPGAR